MAAILARMRSRFRPTPKGEWQRGAFFCMIQSMNRSHLLAMLLWAGFTSAAVAQTNCACVDTNQCAECHKWLDGTTIAFANNTTAAKDAGGTSKTAAQQAGNVDAIWVASHYPGGQNPRGHINFRKPGANRMNLAWFSKQQKWLLRL